MKTWTKSTYSFDRFIEARQKLNHLDNPFLRNVLEGFLEDDFDSSWNELKAFSEKVSGRWKSFSEENARVENHPRILHFDAHNHRIDKIVRSYAAEVMEKEVFSEGLFSSNVSEEERAIKRYLLHHNGEAGLMCPLACTDGLVALLEKFESELNPELGRILHHTKEGIDGNFGIGAQFMTEIQGGSNIPANVLEAVQEGDYYRLYGNKFFCSVTHADYTVVTARVSGADQIGTFVVPLFEDDEKLKRNAHVVNRLKWKLGTCELPSGEIDFQGAKAYLVGPADRGVAIAVSIVLTRSRIDIGFASAAFMMRASREALLYANFRDVFGRKINEFPMAKGQLNELEEAAKRATASAFTIFKKYLHYEKLAKNGMTHEQRITHYAVRELILLQKVFVTKETIEQLRTAITIFGGHGAIEDFSSIPRLFRDAMVNDLWEGPRNVLLAQVYRDMKKALSWCAPVDLLREMLPSQIEESIASLAKEMEEALEYNLYGQATDENIRHAKKWEHLLESIYSLYQEEVMSTIKDGSILPNDVYESVYPALTSSKTPTSGLS